MWPFKRKKASQNPRSRPSCSYCMSTNTTVSSYNGTEQPDYVRTWRGQQYITCRCLDCGQVFYLEGTQQELIEEILSDDEMFNDEEELRAAEDELKRQADDESDHRYNPYK